MVRPLLAAARLRLAAARLRAIAALVIFAAGRSSLVGTSHEKGLTLCGAG
jgi:hypothetical protein